MPEVAKWTAGLLVLTGILYCMIAPFAVAITQSVAIMTMMLLAYLLFKAK